MAPFDGPGARSKTVRNAMERNDLILRALRDKDLTIPRIMENTRLSETTVKRGIVELRERALVFQNPDGSYSIRPLVVGEQEPAEKFLQIAEDAVRADNDLIEKLGDRANPDYRYQKLSIAVGILAAAARAGTVPQLAGMRWKAIVSEGREWELKELRRLLIIAARLLRP